MFLMNIHNSQLLEKKKKTLINNISKFNATLFVPVRW